MAAPDSGAWRLGREERGDIVSGWLFKLVVYMLVIGVIGYEAVAIGLNAIGVADAAQNVAREAAVAYRDRQPTDETAVMAAEEAATQEDVELEAATVVDETIRVTVVGTADTLILHNIGLFDGLIERRATHERQLER